MRMGISLGLQQRGGGGGFSPASLFASSEAGDWFDPSDLSKMWQDTAGTTPVTTDSQTVARIDGQQGVVSLRQADAAKRPQYKTSGGLHWLRFDGTDDNLISSANLAFSGTDASTVAAAVTKRNTSTEGDIIAYGYLGPDNGTFGIGAGTANNYGAVSRGTALVFGGTASIFTSPITNVVLQNAEVTSPVLNLRVNGIERFNSNSTQGSGNYANTTMRVATRGGTDYLLNCDLYFMLIRGVRTTGADLASLETYAGAKAGLTI